MSNTGLQQQGSVGNGAPPAMVPAAGGSVTVGSGNGPKKARSGYNAKAMAEIRNSLRPYEDSNPTNGQLNMANLAFKVNLTQIFQGFVQNLRAINQKNV